MSPYSAACAALVFVLDALLADGILKFLYCEKVNGIFCLIVLLLHASFFNEDWKNRRRAETF